MARNRHHVQNYGDMTALPQPSGLPSRSLTPQQIGQVSSRLRELRKARGWGQERLSAEAGLASGAVGNIESGKANITLATMLALVHALELRSIEELLGPLPTSAIRTDSPRFGTW